MKIGGRQIVGSKTYRAVVGSRVRDWRIGASANGVFTFFFEKTRGDDKLNG